MKRTATRRKAPRPRRAKARGPSYSFCTVKGFCRVQLVDAKTKQIVGDSGWKRNLVVDYGKQNYLVATAGNIAVNATARTIRALALASKTDQVSAGDTTIAGEVGGRKVVADTTDAASNRRMYASPGTIRMICSWASNDIGAAATIGSIAAFYTETAGLGSMMCAASFQSSQWNTDQQVNATYEVRFQ